MNSDEHTNGEHTISMRRPLLKPDWAYYRDGMCDVFPCSVLLPFFNPSSSCAVTVFVACDLYHVPVVFHFYGGIPMCAAIRPGNWIIRVNCASRT